MTCTHRNDIPKRHPHTKMTYSHTQKIQDPPKACQHATIISIRKGKLNHTWRLLPDKVINRRSKKASVTSLFFLDDARTSKYARNDKRCAELSSYRAHNAAIPSQSQSPLSSLPKGVPREIGRSASLGCLSRRSSDHTKPIAHNTFATNRTFRFAASN